MLASRLTQTASSLPLPDWGACPYLIGGLAPFPVGGAGYSGEPHVSGKPPKLNLIVPIRHHGNLIANLKCEI